MANYDRNDIITRARGTAGMYRQLEEAGLIPRNDLFFPSIHYPSITQYPGSDEQALYAGYENPSDGLFDIYVHIPFCERRCSFCHYSIETASSDQEKDRYLTMLDREIQLFLDHRQLRTLRARSVLIGGGTPTNLSPALLRRFFERFLSKVDTSSCTQISVDVNPAGLLGVDGDERMAVMKSAGVGRLTIGIQSLHDGILRSMSRNHTAEEARKSVERARSNGFVVNTEYIYGYPGQTTDDWMDTVEQAAALEPDEVQVYRLMVIPYADCKGAIRSWYAENSKIFPSLMETFIMKEAALLALPRMGYEENLRRVFARKKAVYSHYAHNQCCNLFDQVGFGVSGFSSLRDRFALNTGVTEAYYDYINRGVLPIDRGLIRDENNQIRWAWILPLKQRGIDKALFRKITGVSADEVFRGKMKNLIAYGLLQENAHRIQLTPLGNLFTDEVCLQFHDPAYIPFRREEYAEGPLNPYLNQADATGGEHA